MKVISTMDDVGYYERRAQILIEEARAIRLSGMPLGDESYENKITKAVQLLALAMTS